MEVFKENAELTNPTTTKIFNYTTENQESQNFIVNNSFSFKKEGNNKEEKKRPKQLKFQSNVKKAISNLKNFEGRGVFSDCEHLITSDKERKTENEQKNSITPNTDEERYENSLNKGVDSSFTKSNELKTIIGGRMQNLTKNVVGFVNKLSGVKKKKDKKIKLSDSFSKKTVDKDLIYKRFHRSFQIMKVIFRLGRISEDIQTYGTSSNLFDLTTRDRATVKKVLYPLNEDIENKKDKINEEKLPFYLLHPKSKIRILWTPIVVVLLIYTATIMPYAIVFMEYDETDWSNEWVIIQLIVDILFWMDLFINLFSSHFNEEGILEKDFKVIFKAYLRGWLVFDLIACLPFNYIGSIFIEGSGASSLHLVRLSRLPRLYRLIKITKIAKVMRFLSNDSFFLDYFEFNSGVMRLITLLFTVSILIHLMGCLWYFEAKLDDFGPDTWVFRNNMQDNSNLSLYMTSIYFALTTLATVGYGDIYAKTNTEMITSIIWMLFGVGFYSFTIGILSSVLAYIDTKATNLQKKIAIMNEFCNEMKISKGLKERLRKTLEYNSQKNSFTWAEKTSIFNDLPINLRYEIVMNVHDKVISDILFFKNCDDKFFVVRTVPLLKPLFLKSKENIWIKNTNPDAIYFLINGRVNYVGEFDDINSKKNIIINVKSKEEEKRHFIFKSMVAGSYFGEVEILFKKRREFSVVCEVDCEFYYLSRYDFENILIKEFPHIADQMRIVAKKRDKINKQAFSDVSSLLLTAKEITSLKGNDNPQDENKENQQKPIPRPSKLGNLANKIKNGFAKFKSNRVMPSEETKNEMIKPTEIIEKTTNGDLIEHTEEIKKENKNEEKKSNSSSSDNSSDSESNESVVSNNDIENEETKLKDFNINKRLKSNDNFYKLNKEVEDELNSLKGELKKNEDRQISLEKKIKEIHKTLETTFNLIKELMEEN